jgi:FKBP-type peptidyl-prolyl cis-trans isomerase (trigger factor)
MKTDIKKLDGTKREIDVEVSGDLVKDKFRSVFEKIGKEAKVPGFRPGHVPLDVLEKHFSSQAHEMVLKELIPDVYNKLLDEQKLEVIDLPHISDVKLDRNALSFKAVVEVSPEIPLKNYKGIAVRYQPIAVSPDDVKRSIDGLKEARKAEAVNDSFAKGLGYPGVAELERAIERQLFFQKENQQRQKIESALLESVMKETSFAVPEAMVKRQLEDLVRQAKIDLAMKGMPRDKIEEEEKNISAELKPQAEKQVRQYLALSAIAKKENIALDDHMPQKVMELLLREADWKQEA